MAELIKIQDNRLRVPDQPIIPVIPGDGIGTDITPAMQKVVEAAVGHCYLSRRKIHWKELLAGERSYQESGEHLPIGTLDALRQHVVGIKGPLSTPVGGGIRSLNVAIRQALDLYSCIRPVHWLGGPSPLKHPEKLDIIIFRENTEDVYGGIEFASATAEAKKLMQLLLELGVAKNQLPEDTALGMKTMSPTKTKRHVRKALRWALVNKRRRVTFMHKGNIMKFTEGAFLTWSHQVVHEPEFAAHFTVEGEPTGLSSEGGSFPVLRVTDCIADNLFQQLLTRTEEFDVIVTPNLNGDYLSDAAAGCVGGLGLAPGANIGDHLAIFEASHGSAPRYAGLDKVNPTSLILSGAMMLNYLGWSEASTCIELALKTTLAQKKGTYDLVRGWKREGERKCVELSCSKFAETLIENLGATGPGKLGN